jgi:apolipoprotein N-acyltransferase
MTPRASSSRPSGHGLTRPWVLSVAGGLALAAAFPPVRAWPLAFLAWVPLWLGIERDRDALPWRKVFLRGWLMGFVAYAAMLHWILALSNEEVTIPGIMIPSLLLIAFYLGLFQGAAAAAAHVLARRGGLPFLALAPAFCAIAEWLRSLGPLGFPWGAPAYALARVTPLIQSASIGGFWGFDFLVLATGALLTAGLRGRRRWALLGGALVALLALHGALVLARHPEGGRETGRRQLRVLADQPDIRREIKWKPEKRQEVIDLVFAHARLAVRDGRAAGGFDLYVWPETVFPICVFNDRVLSQRVGEFVDTLGAPVLIGTQEGYWERRNGPLEYVAYNSAVLVSAGGVCSPPYRKIRLVPFSERMPLQKIVPFLTDIDFGQSNFFAGERPVLFTLRRERIGTLICFEAAFPSLARDAVRAGATVLVNITNDFWFGRSAGPIQHADMAILRAVENRVPLVRCANTGVSFAVDPWGRVDHSTPLFAPASFVATVGAGAGSFAARYGDWAVAVLGLWAALALATAIRPQRRRG